MQERDPARAVALAACVLCTVLMAACASQPEQPAGETLDSKTGTTVTRLPRPVELILEHPRGTQSDPFAFLGPFETNRMGERALFLWVAAPDDATGHVQPRVLCDGEALELIPHIGPLDEIGLSRAPYPAPAPWSGQWYFRLPDASLKRLVDAHRITLETQSAAGASDRFSAETDSHESLSVFASRLGGGS